jgi:hypothetical protein
VSAEHGPGDGPADNLEGPYVSYSDPPPPPPQYGEPVPPMGGMPPKKSGMAIAGLVLGIIGVIPCFWACFVFAILGVVFGQLGKKDIRDSQGAKNGEGLAQWGFILGIVGIAAGVIYWILVATGVLDLSYSSEV